MRSRIEGFSMDGTAVSGRNADGRRGEPSSAYFFPCSAM
jgi:hypothetical protein